MLAEVNGKGGQKKSQNNTSEYEVKAGQHSDTEVQREKIPAETLFNLQKNRQMSKILSTLTGTGPTW